MWLCDRQLIESRKEIFLRSTLCVVMNERKYVNQNQIFMIENISENRKRKDYVINRSSFSTQTHLSQVYTRCFQVRISSNIFSHQDVLLKDSSHCIFDCKIHNEIVLNTLCWKISSCTLIWSTDLQKTTIKHENKVAQNQSMMLWAYSSERSKIIIVYRQEKKMSLQMKICWGRWIRGLIFENSLLCM